MTNFSNDTGTGIVVADAFALADGTPIGGGGYTVLTPGVTYDLKSGGSYCYSDYSANPTTLNLPVGEDNSAPITILYLYSPVGEVTVNTINGQIITTNSGPVTSLSLQKNGITIFNYTSNNDEGWLPYFIAINPFEY